MRRIIDTNILKVANKDTPQVLNDPVCILSCVNHLDSIKSNGRIILDNSWQILSEYSNNLNSNGQPGQGDSFFKWVLNNKDNPLHCELFQITAEDNNGNYLEFPTAQDLQNFDHADRKFVALSIVSNTCVSTAVDPGWWEYRDALLRNGVQVEFLCQNYVENYHR